MKRVNVPLMLVTLIASAAHAENNYCPSSPPTPFTQQLAQIAEQVGADAAVSCIADGTYEKAGLKVTIRQGGPQAANRALLIAGKGHEAGQEINGVKHPFDDRDVLAAALEAR